MSTGAKKVRVASMVVRELFERDHKSHLCEHYFTFISRMLLNDFMACNRNVRKYGIQI